MLLVHGEQRLKKSRTLKQCVGLVNVVTYPWVFSSRLAHPVVDQDVAPDCRIDYLPGAWNKPAIAGGNPRLSRHLRPPLSQEAAP